jgi:hypothetical protein
LLNIDRHSNEYTKKWAYDLTAWDGDIVYFADGFMWADTNQDFLQFFEVNTWSMIYDYNSVANWINWQSSLNYTSSDVDTESEIRTVLELNDLIFTKNELVSILSWFGITLSEETQNYARENLIKPYRYDFAKINIIKGTMEEQYYQDSLMRYAQQLSQ